ncbi:MAG: 3-deoxy-7-phosphoheptulonate synthase [Alphaproteobacteria bacterium]|jgi:3-deoxy-7-phosphoheptulonate synthase|nr:3-deoxy-7-phosphoheptulonate synthase [Alphaproteobacteria bacterium]
MAWSINSWQNFTTKHMPKYHEDITDIKTQLAKKDSIVDSKSIDELLLLLSKVNDSNYFIMQMGECAELFANATKEDIFSRVNFIEEVCRYFPESLNIIKIGRIAGQYSKPRSEDFEIINDEKTLVYKGDMFHDYMNREIKASRMLLSADVSKRTYDIMQKFNQEIFTSHEALNLHYEEGFTRLINSKYYNTSAHMLWLGEKTRFLNSSHVEYLRGISNPVGIKISHNISSADLIKIIRLLNPENIPGKIVLINRMGVKNTHLYLENLLQEVKNTNLNVIWMCDPLHGNTYKDSNNYKVRNLTDIIKEITDFAIILYKHKVKFGGIHLENSPKDIYECVDGSMRNIGEKYETLCDPRLNKEQSFTIAKLLAKLIQN